MNIINEIKNSIYNPEFYNSLKDRKIGKSFGYFYVLVLVVSIIFTVNISYRILPDLAPFLSSAFAYDLAGRFPKDLQITVKAGALSSNAKEPYFVKMPIKYSADISNLTRETSPQNLLVIDTKNAFDLAQFQKYDTAILLSKNLMISKNSGGKVSIESLSNFPDITIDKNWVMNKTVTVAPLFDIAQPIIVVLLYFANLARFTLVLGYLVMMALLIMLIARLRKMKINFKESYKIGLHAATLPILVQCLLFIFGVNMAPSVFTLIFLATVLVNFPRLPFIQEPIKNIV